MGTKNGKLTVLEAGSWNLSFTHRIRIAPAVHILSVPPISPSALVAELPRIVCASSLTAFGGHSAIDMGSLLSGRLNHSCTSLGSPLAAYPHLLPPEMGQTTQHVYLELVNLTPDLWETCALMEMDTWYRWASQVAPDAYVWATELILRF